MTNIISSRISITSPTVILFPLFCWKPEAINISDSNDIRTGIKDYEALRTKRDGFDRPIYGDNIKKRNDYVANFFRKIFTKGIDEVVQEIFPNPTNLELYNLALDTIRHNYDSRYSAAQLCIDLNFATMFGISENTLRTQGSHYIEEKIGVSFTDLKFQALNVPKRNYFALAVDLLRAHIDKIGSNRHLYNMGKLAVDLGLHQDFGFPIDSLRSNANRFLMTYTGYTWVDLIKFAQSNIVI